MTLVFAETLILSKHSSVIGFWNSNPNRMFRRMDDDGSRTLNLEEFSKGVRETGLEINDDDVKVLFDKFDVDGSGTVNIDEFLISVRVSQDRLSSLQLDYLVI